MKKEQQQQKETPIHLTEDSTLQMPEEHRRDQQVNPAHEPREVSNDDLHETVADRMAGSDRAGTAERKDNQS